MKTLKITLILTVIFLSFTSCTKQDLNQDDLLITPDAAAQTQFTGGGLDDV